MVLLLDCPQHGLPRRSLCASERCCDLLCDACLPVHVTHTHHSTAIYLNTQAIKFFELFTDRIHRTMLSWAQAVRGKGCGAIFTVEGGEGAAGEWTTAGEEMTRMAVSVLQQHGRLMACNRDFATSNCNSPALYHPEFLRDLFNLIVHPWRHNAQLILIKLAHQTAEIQSRTGKSSLRFDFREEVAVEIQKYRQELLQTTGVGLVCKLQEGKEGSANDVDTEDRSASSRGELSSQGRQVSQFRIAAMPLSIKVIESFEQIEHPNTQPTITSPSTAPQTNVPHETLEQKSRNEEQNNSYSINSMQKLREQNQHLIHQNSCLKNENLSLKEDNLILKEKCQGMRVQRKSLPSSSKKYRQLELDSELLAEIVDLEAELNDNRHDLHILVDYLNSLSRAGNVDPRELNAKMTALRTVFMH